MDWKWKRKSARFAVECKALSTPKFIQNSINYLRSLHLPKNVFPMLIMPFLTEQQHNELEKIGISGIDLCGNCVVVSPGAFSVFRSGGKNGSVLKYRKTISRFNGTRVKADTRRARPKPSVGIHAHSVDEALTLEEGLLPIALTGTLSTGEAWETEIFLPHPYTFSMMKISAFKDRFEDPKKEFGRYHALDLYTILATTTEEEWEYALQLRDQYKDDPYAKEAGRLVSEYFSTKERFSFRFSCAGATSGWLAPHAASF